MTREEAAKKLLALVDSWTDNERLKQQQLSSVAVAVTRYAEATYLTNTEASLQAQKLADAAHRFVAELKRSESFWRYMSRWGFSGESKKGSGIYETTYSARNPWLPRLTDILMHAEIVEIAASAMVLETHSGVRVADQFDRDLGFALAFAFRMLTRRNPGFSMAEAKDDDPRSHFGRFVQLTLLAAPESDTPRVRGIKLRSFIQRAKQHFDAISGLNRESASGTKLYRKKSKVSHSTS
jgi:hypothetical protein